MTIPSLWRIELLHPLLVHLPIGLLLFGSVCGLLSEVRRFKSRTNPDDSLLRLLLVPGAAFAWGAVYTGSMAEDVVNRKICDPTVTARHEDLALIAVYIFTAAAVLVLVRAPLLRRCCRAAGHAAMALSLGLILLLCTGSYYLINAAHLGASLVYLQAAGVYQPSQSCNEFE